MGPRRIGRELVVQFFYQWESHSTGDWKPALVRFWEFAEAKAVARKFAERMVEGMMAKLPAVDARIRELAANWDFDRIAVVDRAILRLAIYELLFCEDIPPVVSINEAIEIAKRFSTEESGRFVNGILDQLRKELPRPARQAAGGSAPAGKGN